ncbi:MAG: ABC transporter ATP-binding protein [Clostridium sp. SCN 57-10]|nr:MAG: ABC transporter ATP-binding protein [Clostridium sp. SCN 57-10]
MCPTASAVSLRGVTKQFTQWQRDTTAKSMWKNLLKPEKRVINALREVSFDIRPGEFVAYAGPNGAGKSTTMKLLSGMLLPTEGEISVLGMSPQRQRKQLMTRLGVLFGNRTELWWDHPVIQSFEWKKVVWDIPEDTYRTNLAMVTELLDLGGLLHTFVRELSLGQRMRADLALLLLHSPELILLDEPTLGLDVVAKRQMIDFLKKINRESGVTIVVTSHDMDDLEEMAQRILMIAGGAIAYDGSFDGLRAVTGNLTRVIVTTGGADAPQLTGAALLASENGVHTYEADLTRTPVRELMRLLSELDVRDVEIKKAPIEQVIARLYESWR